MITVCCVWVKANVPYDVEYVTKLYGMVSRHLSRPFRFVCLTDQPEKIPATIHVGRLPRWPKDLFGWWAKVHLFDPYFNHNVKGRMLYLDLDTLVVSDLAPIVDYPAQFALVPHAGTFNGRDGLQVVKRFNSSVMVWDAGTQNHVYDNFVPTKTPKRLWGDQDHIGEQCPFAATMPAEWFPRLSQIDDGSFMTPAAKVVLCKKPKNSVAAKTMPGFAEAWG